MLRPLNIGKVHLARPVLLAPMAGVTDAPFRRQAEAFGAPYTVSEMVAGEQLAAERPDMVRRAARTTSGAPMVVQIAGREAKWMALGAKLAADAGADVIDINFGCPAKKVTSGLAGAALMRDLDCALRLVEATVAASPVPVTCKMRLGWDEESLNAPELARRAEGAGVAMIAVHGRTRSQFYSGRADWRAIARVKAAVAIPVIANGDIADAADAEQALAHSGADGVMLGRATNGRPWLVGEVGARLAGESATTPSPGRILESLLELYEDSLSLYGVALGVNVARKHLAWAIEAAAPGLSQAERAAVRGRICRLEDPAAVKSALSAVFSGVTRCAA